MTVERRDVGKWLRKALARRPKTDANGGNASISRRRPRPVRAGWHVGSGLSAGGRSSPRVSRQTAGVCAAWAAVLGGGTGLAVGHRMITHPLTGEPDAGDPPVRFGGRGWVQSLAPTSITITRLRGQADSQPFSLRGAQECRFVWNGENLLRLVGTTQPRSGSQSELRADYGGR